MATEINDIDEQEHEHLWLDEAQRRDNDYKSGTLPARDAFAAIAEMRGKI